MIVAGFGFQSAATAASLRDALSETGSQTTVDAIATIDDKTCAKGFRTLAADMSLPIIAVSAPALRKQVTQTQSAVSQGARGTGSVAEAAALAAAGPGAKLLAPRVKSSDGKATCALAIGEGA